jgi:hypothetical protein
MGRSALPSLAFGNCSSRFILDPATRKPVNDTRSLADLRVDISRGNQGSTSAFAGPNSLDWTLAMQPNIRKRLRPMPAAPLPDCSPAPIGHNRTAELRLKIEYLETTGLTRPKREIRKHSSKQIDQIAASICRFGNMDPIVIDADGRVGSVRATCPALESAASRARCATTNRSPIARSNASTRLRR